MYNLAVYDADYIAFAAASLAEEKTINVIHKQSGREKEFKTRTEFYGHWRKKNGGWLADINKGKETPFLVEEFDVVDVQTPAPFGMAVNVVNTIIDSVQQRLGLSDKDYYGFVGKGKSFREDVSTIIKYKGNRESSMRPIHLDAIKQYLVDKKNCEWQSGIEVDDRVVMECYKKKDRVLVAVDKDSMGTACNVFNPDKMDVPKDCNVFGKIYIDDQKEVRGVGRKWFYLQCLYGDDSDNYFANSACNTKWGKKSAYDMLAPCKTDKECWQALVDGYKQLYPEPKTITGWRGDDILIDWKYVMQENVTLAHMLRFDGDKIIVADVLDRLGIIV